MLGRRLRVVSSSGLATRTGACPGLVGACRVGLQFGDRSERGHAPDAGAEQYSELDRDRGNGGAALLSQIVRRISAERQLRVIERTRLSMGGGRRFTWTLSGRYDRNSSAAQLKLRKHAGVADPTIHIRRIGENRYVSNDGWTGATRGKWLLVTPELERRAAGSDPFYSADSALPTPTFAILDHLDPQAQILRQPGAGNAVTLRTSVSLGDATPVLEPIFPSF